MIFFLEKKSSNKEKEDTLKRLRAEAAEGKVVLARATARRAEDLGVDAYDIEKILLKAYKNSLPIEYEKIKEHVQELNHSGPHHYHNIKNIEISLDLLFTYAVKVKKAEFYINKLREDSEKEFNRSVEESQLGNKKLARRHYRISKFYENLVDVFNNAITVSEKNGKRKEEYKYRQGTLIKYFRASSSGEKAYK